MVPLSSTGEDMRLRCGATASVAIRAKDVKDTKDRKDEEI